MPITIHDIAKKKLHLRFTTAQYVIIGKAVSARFRELNPGKLPVKIKVDLMTKKKEPFYWWCNSYETDFVPEIERIILESAQALKEKKKRPRLQKPVLTAKPIEIPKS